jgi:hypothetical protein
MPTAFAAVLMGRAAELVMSEQDDRRRDVLTAFGIKHGPADRLSPEYTGV